MIKVFIVGRLSEAPVLQSTQTGIPVCTLRAASSRQHNREIVDYISIVTWRGLAENCARYLVKGQQIAVVGELQSRHYEDKDGNKRTVYEVSAEDIEFLAKPQKAHPDLGEEIPIDDENLPF